MSEMTFEELQRKYPPADQEVYDRAYAAAELAGAMAELVYGMRTTAGLTQADLAARIGSTQSSVARMESGSSLPTIEMIARLARATGVSVRLEAPGVADVEILAGRRGPRAATRPGRRRPSRRRIPSDPARDRADAGQERERA